MIARRFWTAVEAVAICLAVALVTAGVCVALPNRLRVLGLFAAVAGLACGAAVGWAFREIGLAGGRQLLAGGAVSAAIAVLAYGGWSVRQFAAAERPKNGREAMVDILLDQLPDDVRDEIPVDPLSRWLRWRVKATGLIGDWPAVLAAVEAAVAVAAGGWAARRFAVTVSS